MKFNFHSLPCFELSERNLVVMMNICLDRPKKYEIVIEEGIFKDIGKEVRKVYKGSNIAVITDENVYALYGKQIEEYLFKENYKPKIIAIKGGENSKSFETLMELYSKLAEFIKRNDLIIAFGGGVIGDLAGFAASTYMRGVKLIQIPTTLLSQTDSSVGGKTAINLPEGKNLVGSFYHPERVIIDPLFLKTLPDRIFCDGLGEVIKYACIKNEALFNELMAAEDIHENIEMLIYTCLTIKKDLVEKDEKDYGPRMLLNFGHTLGHAIEKHFSYTIGHGQAICMGMYHITKASENLKLTKSGTLEKLTLLLDKFNLDYELPLSTESIIKYIYLDKKNDVDYINLILLKEIGNAFIYKLSMENIRNFMTLE